METVKNESVSEKFRKTVYDEYFNQGGNTAKALKAVNTFLEEHPNYPEALIFKARMLIVGKKYDTALSCLEEAKRFDEWRPAYAFEMAEIHYKIGEKPKSIKLLEYAIQTLLDEVLNGIDNFLIGIDAESEKETKNNLMQDMIYYLSNRPNHFKVNNLF